MKRSSRRCSRRAEAAGAVDGDARLRRIWRAVAAIPHGQVDTYGGVARRAGLPGRARLVGHALKVAPADLALPWHRVLAAGLRITFPSGSAAHREQRRLLVAEGHRCVAGRLLSDPRRPGDDLDEWLWKPRQGGH